MMVSWLVTVMLATLAAGDSLLLKVTLNADNMEILSALTLWQWRSGLEIM
jgi:hypothetical protein